MFSVAGGPSIHDSRSAPFISCAFSDKSATDNAASRVVASLLLQKEEELKAITAPGSLAPKAAVVAALRREIATLREQIKSSVKAQLPPNLATDLPTPSVPSAASSATYKKGKHTLGTSRPAPMASGARGALLLVEHQLSVSSSAAGGVGSVPQPRGITAMQAIEQNMALGSLSAIVGDANAELLALQQENAVLQAQLEVLVGQRRHLQMLKQRLDTIGTSPSSTQLSTKKDGNEEGPKKRRVRRSTKAKAVDGEAGEKKKEDVSVPGQAPRRRKKSPKLDKKGENEVNRGDEPVAADLDLGHAVTAT